MRCSLEARNSVGSTVLHAAISSGAKGSIEQLVAFGSKLDTEDEEGNSVLHGALYVQKRTQDQQDFALVDICHCQVSSSPLIDEVSIAYLTSELICSGAVSAFSINRYTLGHGKSLLMKTYN